MASNKSTRRLARYGPPGYYEHVTERPCVVPKCEFRGTRWGRIEFEHWRTWGSGHGYEFGVPMCKGHHAKKGSWGVTTFQKRYQINLERIARGLYESWLKQAEW